MNRFCLFDWVVGVTPLFKLLPLLAGAIFIVFLEVVAFDEIDVSLGLEADRLLYLDYNASKYVL